METKTKAYLDIGLDFEELRSTKRSSALGHCQALTNPAAASDNLKSSPRDGVSEGAAERDG